jgi:hypothetical protein
MEDSNIPTKTFQDVKSSPEIVWLGIDFTRAKFIGPSGFNDVHSIINTQLHSMNDLFVREPQKYNFSKFLGKTARYKIDVVYQRNLKISPEGLILLSDPGNRFDQNTIQQVVDECQFPKDNLIGLMYIVETLDKNQQASFVWVTFIDLANGKVILTGKYAGRAGGFGFRNFWAGSFFDIMKQFPSMMRR